MAARVNTRFVVLISTVMVGLAVAAVVAYLLFFVEDPEELIARGDAYFEQAETLAIQVDQQEGDAAQETFARSGEAYMLAAEMYGKAFNERRTDVDLLVKYIDTIGKVHVDSALKAQTILQEQDGKLLLATQISDRNDLLERYYAQMMEQLLWGGNANSVNSILNRILTNTNVKLETDRDNPVALKYRGVARTLQLDDSSDLDDYKDAKEDLDKAAAALPEDEMIPMFVAKWHIAEARRIRQPNEGRPDNGPARPISEEVQAEVQTAVDLSRATLERFGADDIETRFRHIENLLAFPVFRPTEPDNEDATTTLIDEVRGVVDNIRDELMADPSDMDAVLRLGDIMTRLDREVIRFEDRRGQTTEGIERTEELLKHAAASEPLNVIYRVYLGNLLKLQMDLSEALEAYKEADQIQAVGPAEMILRELHFKRQARYEIANIELIQAENEQDPEVRKAKLAAADQAIEELDQVLEAKAPVNLLRGKVAMLRGQNTIAMQELDRAADLFLNDGNLNIEAMLLSARARQQERQWGAAADRLERVLALPQIKGSPESEQRLRAQLAEIYINSDRRVDARVEIDRLYEIGQKPRVTQLLDAGLLLREGKVDQAVERYDELGMMSQASTVRNVARALSQAGRNEEAVTLLRDALAEQPAALPLITQLMATLRGDVEERRAEVRALLDAAEQAGAPAPTVAALRASVTPLAEGDDQQRDEMVAKIRNAASDEIDAELRESSLWERLGDEAKSRAAYRRAEALDPNDSQVILTGIKFAARDNNTQKLEQLAERASRENIDLANGDFVRGQIAATQGDLNEAISFYNSGLTKRPVYDAGWKALGDLYVRRGSLDDANNAYQTAVNQKPDNVAALVALADVNRQRRRPTAAVSAMRDALRHAPDNPGVIQMYLRFETELGDPSEALRVQESLVERDPENLQLQLGVVALLAQMGEYDDALDRLDQIESQSDAGATLLTTQTRASIASQGGDAEQGRAVFESYLSERGSEATASERLAFARYLMSIDESAAALEQYESAIVLDEQPEKSVTREYADRLFDLARFDEAAVKYEELLGVAEADDEASERLVRRYVETLLRLGRADEALALLDDQPNDAETLVLRSLIARQQERPDEAEALLDEAIELRPDYALAYLQRGIVRATRDMEGALADANKALEINPQFAGAQSLRARLLTGMGQADDAIRAFNSVLASNPRDSVSRAALAELYLREGDLQTGRLVVAEGTRFDPNNPIWAQLEARFALAGGDPEQVILKLEEAVAASPSPVALQALSEAYLRADRAAETLQLLNDHPGPVNANVLLQARKGQALVTTGSPEPGARLLALSMARSANRGQLGYTVRAAAEALSLDAAFQLVDAAISQADRRLDVLIAKAMVCMGQREFDRALEFLPEAEALAADRDAATLGSVLRMTALCYYSTDQYEKAEQAYRRLLDKNADDVESLNNLAFLLAKELNRPADALPLAERAVALTDPPQASVMDTLGIVQFMNGQIGRSRETLENALLLDRELAPLHLHLAQVYNAQDLGRRATQSLQEAIRLAEISGDRDTEAQAREFLEQW